MFVRQCPYTDWFLWHWKLRATGSLKEVIFAPDLNMLDDVQSNVHLLDMIY